VRRQKHVAPGKGAVLSSAAVHGIVLLAAVFVHRSYEPPVQ
jgi:hypothetical protein